MSIIIYPSDERGERNHGWLLTKHSFSFADYYNPDRMGFGLLRVLNEDIIAPGQGFGKHGHRDMEIVTLVLEGALEHKDSMGNKGIITSTDVQRMSAGTGVTHSEFNHSQREPCHLLQIWIETKTPSLPPSYEQRSYALKKNELHLVVSGTKDQHAIFIHQHTFFYLGIFDSLKEIKHTIHDSNGAFLFVIQGSITLDNFKLEKGDAAGITENKATFFTTSPSKILLIDVPLTQ